MTKSNFCIFFTEAHLYRIRQEYLPTSPIAPNFVLHPAFISTDKGQRFLLYDSNVAQTQYRSASAETGRRLIYASDLELMILSKSKRVASDGTFETAPQISHQNYIIMGESEETTSGKCNSSSVGGKTIVDLIHFVHFLFSSAPGFLFM